MAAKKRKPADPLAKKVKASVRAKGYTLKGQPTKEAQKAADEAIREYRQQQVARMADFEADHYDPSSDSFPALEKLSDPEHPEYDPDAYNEILAVSGIDPAYLQDVGLSPIDVTGATRDISRGTSENLGDVEDYEDIENSDLSGSNLLGGAISEILGKEQRGGTGGKRRGGRTVTGLEEGGAAARTAPPARAPQPAAPTSSRRSTTIPRLKTVGELVDEQRLWAGETRSGEPQRPFVQPQSLKTSDSGKDLGVSAITSTPENREAREQNKVRLMVGTFNELVDRENAALGNEPSVTPSGRVQRLGDQSMTIPVEGSAPAAQPEQAAVPAVTPPTPGRVIRSSNAAGRPMATRDGAVTMHLGDVTGANDAAAAPAPVPGRPAGPRRMSINRAASGDVRLGQANPSGMSTQLQKFLRDNQMAGIIGPGSRSGGALVKGADAVTRRMGGEALGSVRGDWNRAAPAAHVEGQRLDPSAGDVVDLNNPATAVTQTDSGAFELANPLQVRTDPMDPDYVPYANAPQIPIRDISGEEGEKAVREIQAAILRSGKPASFTGRRPSRTKDPLPGPTVMEQTNTEQYGSDVIALARAYGISNMDAARRIAAGEELRTRKEDIVGEGTEAVTTSGEELNILREKPGKVTSVKGQMTKVKKAGGGTENVRTNIPTAEELLDMFPRKGDEDDDAYAKRLATYLVPERSVLTPDEMEKKNADFEATKKASRQARMPKPASKAQQARERKLKEKRIAEEQAPHKAYTDIRSGANAEYDTLGLLVHDINYVDMMTEQNDRVLQRGTPFKEPKPFDPGDHPLYKEFPSFDEKYPPKRTPTPTPTSWDEDTEDLIQAHRSARSMADFDEGDSAQRMANIRRADALVAARPGGFARMPLEGETMADMARRVGGAGGFRQMGRSAKSERKAARKATLGTQFGGSTIGEQQ